MPNPFVHSELQTTDIKAAKEFYGQLFDWTLEDIQVPGMTYTLVKDGDRVMGGMFQMTEEMKGLPPVWMSYVLVDDIKAATEKARALGAKIMKECHEVPGKGWLTILLDPTNACLGLWQATM